IDITHKQTFESQLSQADQLSVIAEIKSKSPTLSELPGRDLTQQVRAYEAFGANAVSILTDEHYFGGSYERLQTLTQVTDLPVLCKDFVVDPIQIDVAKKAGRSEEHTSELQSRFELVCRLLLEKKNDNQSRRH